jgi:4-hydroxybenzoate polyprenyltransferase
MKPSFATVFILIAATYIYATSLKQMAVVGNIIVAPTLSLSVIIVGVLIFIQQQIVLISR